MAGSLGPRFVAALAAKDHAELASLLHPGVDFRGMTPGRFWEASTPPRWSTRSFGAGSRTATRSTRS